MAAEVGVNSYIDLNDANAYFADMLDAGEWEAANDATKEKALVTATRNIDRERIIGKKYSDDQPLQFPRLTDGAIIPQVVMDACCEEALFLLKMTSYQKKRETDHALGIVGETIGDASERAHEGVVQKITQGRGLFSPVAKQLLKPYTTFKGAFII